MSDYTKEDIVNLVVSHLLSLNEGTFDLTEEEIMAIEDPAVQEVLTGFMCLHEDLIFKQQRRMDAERQLKQTHDELLAASRRAGMAEMASNILHDTGNAINSARVALSLLEKHLHNAKLSSLQRIIKTIPNDADGFVDFIQTNPRGQHFPSFLAALANHLVDQQDALEKDIHILQKNLNHIKHIIRTQQSYTRSSGEVEGVDMTEVIDLALHLSSASFERYEIQLIRDYQSGLPWTRIDRHRVLQILTNLLNNARHALRDSDTEEKALRVGLRLLGPELLRITVNDNGIGMAPDVLSRIFEHAFTTKVDGNGFGLHSSINAAKAIGARLSAQSPGLGKGSTFILDLPFDPVEAQPPSPPSRALSFLSS